MSREVLSDTIRIAPSLKKFLDDKKIIDEESYNSVIQRLVYPKKRVKL